MRAGTHDLEVKNLGYPPSIVQKLFVGPGAEVRLVAKMGVPDLENTLAATLLPGLEQYRDDSTLEAIILSLGSATLVGVLTYHIATYVDMRSDYNRSHSDYLHAMSEEEAFRLRIPLSDQFSAVARQRNLVLGIGAVLGGFLSYNIVDVILHHQPTKNVLEPVQSPRKPQPSSSSAQLIVTAKLRL